MTKKTWILTLMFAVPWTVLTVAHDSIVGKNVTLRAILLALISGLIAGFLFSLLMPYLGKRLLAKVIVSIDEDEQVIKEAGANHFKGAEGVGGKLVLTNKRLIFKSHRFNVQNHQQEFPVEKIVRLKTAKTVAFFQNAIILELEGNSVHKFVVDEPKEWVEIVYDQKSKIGL